MPAEMPTREELERELGIASANRYNVPSADMSVAYDQAVRRLAIYDAVMGMSDKALHAIVHRGTREETLTQDRAALYHALTGGSDV